MRGRKARRSRAVKLDAVDPEVLTLARTILGEAGAESVRGKEAVAAVVVNRVRRARDRGGYWWGATVAEVCRRPWQFPGLEKTAAAKTGGRDFEVCLRIARRAVNGVLDDPTGGATHYHAKGDFPPWARGRTACFETEHHQFYDNVE